MASLRDIGVAPRFSVGVGGVAVDVRSLELFEIATLLDRFPQIGDFIRAMMPGANGGAASGEADKTKAAVDSLLAMGEAVVAAIVAAGCGGLGDPDVEAVARGLALAHKIEFLAVIFKLTAPEGIGPLADRLAALGMLERKPPAPGTAPQDSTA